MTLQTLLTQATEALDVPTLTQRYQSQGEHLVIDGFLPPSAINEYFAPEIQLVAQYAHRVHVPRFKQSGSVSYATLQRMAPNLFNLYKKTNIKGLIEQLVGSSLVHCPESDPHSAALYFYTEPGDHIGVHYDKSFYKGERYTVLLGMVQESTASQLICYPGATTWNRRKNPTPVSTQPGSLVVFNGNTLWHEVSPLAENECRIIFTMEFLTDTRISPVSKLISDLKDRYLYFGKHTTPKTLAPRET